MQFIDYLGIGDSGSLFGESIDESMYRIFITGDGIGRKDDYVAFFYICAFMHSLRHSGERGARLRLGTRHDKTKLFGIMPFDLMFSYYIDIRKFYVLKFS